MRNTAQYPITFEEALSVIDNLHQTEIDKMSIGSIQPLILRYIKQYITENEDSFKEFLKSKY